MLLLVLQVVCAWGVEIPPGAPNRIGNLGEPAQVSIEGTQIFTDGEIRGALGRDLDYLIAAHPEATLSECLTAVEQRIRAGYRDCGFPNVVVQARYDLPAGRIVVKINEGPRFRCGALQVTGLKSISAAEFTRRFAEKLVPESDPGTTYPGIWKTGVPASFTAESLANYYSAASNTFASLGRFAAKYKVEIHPQPAGTNAALVVSVEDEGPKAILLGIELAGNKQNRRDDVINFLGLAKGMAITQDLIDEKTRALTQAARFMDAAITPVVLDSNGQVALRIKVVERAQLPLLTQSVSREERTLLRLREWLLAWESRQDDLIIDWTPPTAQSKGPLTYLPGQGWSATNAGQRPPRFEVIVAPSGGIMARVMGNSPGQEHPQDLYSAIIKARALSVFAQVHQRKLHIPLPPGNSGLIFVKVAPDDNVPDQFKLTMGAGFSPAQTNDNWRLRLELLPAAFADLLYRPDTQATWQGDILTVRTKRFVLRVEEGTGRLLEAESIDSKPAASAGAADVYRIKIRFATGAFAEAQEQIATSTSRDPDVFRSQRAYGSALGFFAAEVALAEPLWNSPPGGPTPEPKIALASALEKLLAGSFLDPLQKLLDGAAASRSDDVFTIPSKWIKSQGGVLEQFEQVMVWCAGNAQELAPADSWLQTLLRESAFNLNSRTEHQTAALARLAAADNLGPLGCYGALHVLQTGKGDSWAIFPELGLKRLTTTQFRWDYRMLLSSGSVMTECLANLARELGTLTPPEVEAMAGLLPPDSAALMREVAAAARQAQDQPVADAIGPAMDRWWETTGREKIGTEFRLHGQSTVTANSAPSKQDATGEVYVRAHILAVVNNRVILDGDLLEKLSPGMDELRRQYSNAPAVFKQKLAEQEQVALESVINDELVFAEAVAAGRTVPQEHLDQYTQKVIRNGFDGDTNSFLKTLAANGETLKEWQAALARHDLIVAAWQEKMLDVTLPTAEQIEQYYQAHEKDFRVEESVQISMIVINKNPTNGPAVVESQRKDAAAIHTRLVAGADFAAEAKLHSQGGQAQQGGDYGWLERSVLRKELADVAFSLPPGGLSEVIETDGAFFLLRVADRRPAALKPLAEVRADIIKTLKVQASTAMRKEWLGELRAKAYLQIWGGGSEDSHSPKSRMVTNEIKHIGPSTIRDAAIRSQLCLKQGDLPEQTSVEHDIRSLYGTGDFYNIRVSEAIVDGGSKLIYYVQEKPVVSDIQFTGNKNISSGELLSKLTSKAGERLDEWKLFKDSQTIQSQYQKAGFPKVVVKSVPKIDQQTGRGSVTFELAEGLK
jgi:parvulin-like peptidyl-prolyl isomerase